MSHRMVSLCKDETPPLVRPVSADVPNSKVYSFFKYQLNAHFLYSITIYRVIQEGSAIFLEMIVCVILSKKVHMNMSPILNGYRDMVKRRYGPSCEHEQQLRNK